MYMQKSREVPWTSKARETQNDIEIPAGTKFSLKIDRTPLGAAVLERAAVARPRPRPYKTSQNCLPQTIDDDCPHAWRRIWDEGSTRVATCGGQVARSSGRRYFWAAVEDPGVKYMDIWYQPRAPGRAQYCLLWPSRIDLVWWLLGWWRRSVGVPARLLDGSWRTQVTRRN